jgi:formamidase
MPETLIKVDLDQSAYENEQVHNRWHPDIPMACWVKPGDDFILETYDWTGGFIKNDDSADDVRDIDLSIVHFLSGPVGVHGAEPGDLLVVDLLDIGAKADSQWGFNGFFRSERRRLSPIISPARRNRSGTSRACLHQFAPHSGREFRGPDPPGLIGCLPDRLCWKRGMRANRPDRHRPRARAAAGQPAVRGHRAHGQARGRRARQGRRARRTHRAAARAWRQLRHQGSVARLGVFPGLRGWRGPVGGRPALQPGRRRDHLLRRHRNGRLGAHARELIKGGMAKYGIKNPIFKPSPITPNYNDYLIFEGISVDEQGGQHYLDVTIAYRQACLNAIEYLKKFGYSGAQAYSLLGCAPVQGISAAWWTFRTPARPCGCPRRSSTSTFARTPTARFSTSGRRGSAVFAGSREGVSDRLKSRRNRRLSCQSTTSNAQAAGRSPSCAASRIAKNRAAVPTAARKATASSARHRSR